MHPQEQQKGRTVTIMAVFTESEFEHLALLVLFARITIPTFPNPIHITKTSMQLQKFTCRSTVRYLWYENRLHSHYRGFSASLAGVLESATYLGLCEQMRKQAEMRFKLNQLHPVHCIYMYMYLAAVCNLVTSLWYLSTCDGKD